MTTEPFQITGPGKYRLRDGEIETLGHDTDGYVYWPWSNATGHWRSNGSYGKLDTPHDRDIVARVEDEAKPEAQPALTERERMRWQAMCAAHTGLIANNITRENNTREELAAHAARDADAMLAEFDKGVKK